MPYGAFAAQKLSIRTRPARSSLRESQTKPLPRHPVCAPGPVTPATRSGLSQLYCTRSATRSRTAPKVDLAGWDPSQAKNFFAGQTVYAIVLELPDSRITRRCRRQAPDRCLGRGHARHRCRRMALDQPHRSSHDPAAVRAVQRRSRQSSQCRASGRRLRNLRRGTRQEDGSRGCRIRNL